MDELDNNNNDNTKEPLNALSSLEEITKDWSNVLDQTYTLGTTIFKDNAFTACNDKGVCKKRLILYQVEQQKLE